jgi:uncharacterized membrane protein YeaQ/YmgE (transglycosylase-associated protein family)
MDLLVWIIVGAIGGWLASFIVKIPIGGIFGNIVAGIVGGLLVGWLSQFFGIFPSVTGLNLPSIIAAFIGAIIVAAVVGFLTRGRGESAASTVSSSAGSMAAGASDMAKSAGTTVSSTASSAAAATTAAAAGAASMTKDAASGATDMTKDAMSGAAGMAGAAMGAMNMDQMSGMLNGILGGNMKLDANSPLGQMVMPMADGVTAKLGLPKEIGQMVVVFAMAKIAELMQAKMGTGAAPSSNANLPTPAQADEVLGKLNSGAGIDAGSLQSMGLSSELAKKTGISEEQATQGLQYAFGALSAGMSGQKTYEGINLPDMSMLKGMMK